MKFYFSFIFSVLVLLSSIAPAGASSYKKAVKTWSRSESTYRTSDLAATIVWEATYLSDEMLEAQAKEYIKIYHTPVAEQSAVLPQLRSKREGETLFFVSFYSNDRHFDDLLSQRAGWELRLEVNGQSIKPSHMEKTERATPLQQRMYPYLNSWSRGYYVWFPINDVSFPFTLSLHGPTASSSLLWK